MHPLLRKLLGFNWLLHGLMLALMGYGIYAVYSATWMRTEVFYRDHFKWALGLPAGIFRGVARRYRWARVARAAALRHRSARRRGHAGASHTVNGAKGWLNLGVVNFQPSQLALLAASTHDVAVPEPVQEAASLPAAGGCGVIAARRGCSSCCKTILAPRRCGFPLVFGVLFIAEIRSGISFPLLLLGAAVIPLVIKFRAEALPEETAFSRSSTRVLDPQGAGWD